MRPPTASAVDIETVAPDPAPDESIVLSEYNAPTEIPPSLSLPCDGRGTVNFVPDGASGVTASVAVEFVGQP
ncbi:MAG: hypothetical protein JOZ87_37700 [Chloroflexi bacterium]|nr:hypothetical protein [Chloroflexota bacterium]